MNSRERGYIIRGLESLNHIRFVKLDGNKRVFSCEKCGEEIYRKRIIKHFSHHNIGDHFEIYELLKKLMKAWNIIESGDDFNVQKRYQCGCGRSYSSSANLAYHRRKKGHRRVYGAEKRNLSVQSVSVEI